MAQRKDGEADSYYNPVPDGQNNARYAPPSSMQYPPQAANNAYHPDSNPQYQQPPNYGQTFQNPEPPPNASGDEKQTFGQVFKIGALFLTVSFLSSILSWNMEHGICLAAGHGSS